MASESAFIEQPDIDCEALDEALDESPLELSVSGEKPPVHCEPLTSAKLLFALFLTVI